MKILIMLATIIIFCSCSDNIEEYYKIYDSDKEFISFIEAFKLEAENHKVDTYYIYHINIKFRDHLNVSPDVIYKAVCMFQKRLILVDKYEWDKLDVIKKEILIYHQLGHCFLNRRHNNVMIYRINKYINVSIMNEYDDFDSNDYIQYKKQYMNELFLGEFE